MKSETSKEHVEANDQRIADRASFLSFSERFSSGVDLGLRVVEGSTLRGFDLSARRRRQQRTQYFKGSPSKVRAGQQGLQTRAFALTFYEAILATKRRAVRRPGPQHHMRNGQGMNALSN